MQPETTPTPETLTRKDFLRDLGLSTGALMAFYCMGTLTACSKSDSDNVTPTPNPTTSTGFTGNADTSKGAIDFTLTLTSTDYSKLKTQGEFVKVGSVIVANAKGGVYVAIQRICTHQQEDQVAYRLATNDFFCSAHGSVYATDGSVKTAAESGQKAMTLYKTTLSADGNSLRVTA